MTRILIYVSVGVALALTALLFTVGGDEPPAPTIVPDETGQALAPTEPPAPPEGARRLTFATDWRAQAEQGGFYQALARGYYAERGLGVTIRQGGPGSNVPQLMAAKAIDFGLGSNSFIALNMADAGLPARAVMASFQKDPQVLIAHPDQGVNDIVDMADRPIFLADASIGAFWVWLKARYGFTDAQVRKYTFNNAPFLANPQSIQQGYITSEPFTIEREAGFKPKVFLLADYGYPSYGAMILAHNDMIAEDPQVVQDFVDASIEGWLSYLQSDPSAGDALIMGANPEMTEERLAEARNAIIENGIVESGDALEGGVGVMTHSRWAKFFATMASNGVYERTLPLEEAYTLQFVGGGPSESGDDDPASKETE
ncbi:MAG: ABC transporter substrate-binding protein [Pseudomonadota bacterium]